MLNMLRFLISAVPRTFDRITCSRTGSWFLIVFTNT